MGSIKEKIKYIKETKKLIREAIIAQGVDVPENTTFRDYANKIDSIKILHMYQIIQRLRPVRQ